MALDRRQARRAIELVQRLLRQVPEHRALDRAPALDLLVRARTARGELDEAGADLEAPREVVRIVGTAPMRASADTAAGTLQAARGDHERARALLEDAVDRFERSGAPFEAARPGSSSPQA